MTLTRIPTDTLALALAEAERKIQEAQSLLAPFLVVLTEEERATLLRPREGFFEAGRALARAVREHPTLQAATEFDPEAVEEDLQNSLLLASLSEKLRELAQRVADSRLAWLAEAYAPSLSAYALAKVMAKTNGALRTVLDALSPVFATYRTRRAELPAPTK